MHVLIMKDHSTSVSSCIDAIIRKFDHPCVGFRTIWVNALKHRSLYMLPACGDQAMDEKHLIAS